MRFDRVVAQCRDQLAVESESQRISFEVLQKQSRRLARLLRLKGVAQGATVAVCLEDRCDVVTAHLGDTSRWRNMFSIA